MESEGIPLLPEDLHIEILLRLPVRSLLRFKTVCKSWDVLIRSPSFRARYSGHDVSNAREDGGQILCFRKDPVTKTHVVLLLDPSNSRKTTITDLEWPPFPDEQVENKQEFCRGVTVLGPVNGIYCIYNRLIDRWIGTLTLWNPATREYRHILPPVAFPFPWEHLDNDPWDSYNRSPYYKLHQTIDIGFGLDSSIIDFKIVVVYYWYDGGDGYGHWLVRVYSLSTDSWKTKYHFAPCESVLKAFDWPGLPTISSSPQFAHCFLNGAFHWSCCWRDAKRVCKGILAFDMAAESFRLIEGPPLCKHYTGSTWVLNDSLAMAAYSRDWDDIKNEDGTIEVWIMMQYGVEDSWVRLYSFGSIRLSLVGVPNDSHIFFRDNEGQLVSCTFGHTEVYEEHAIYETKEEFQELYERYQYLPVALSICETLGVLKYVETLTPLKDT